MTNRFFLRDHAQKENIGFVLDTEFAVTLRLLSRNSINMDYSNEIN